MKHLLSAILLLSLPLTAAEPKAKAAGPKAPKAVPVAITAPLEQFLLLPEPRVMRSARSVELAGARRTVFSPAKEIAEKPGVALYNEADFNRLGISPQSFADRAKSKADARLAATQPEQIKESSGALRYLVFRSDSPTIASLLVAPGLAKLAATYFGGEAWVATPDRHSLYVFPAKPEAVAEFTEDLAQRYKSNAFAASPELFSIKASGELSVVGQFAD
jgi:hypothetical protein